MELGHYPDPSKKLLIKPLFKTKEREKDGYTADPGQIMDQDRSMASDRDTEQKEMQTHVHTQLQKGYIRSVCFLDVSAGFDTVPHTYIC